MKLLYRGGFTPEERRRSRIELRRNVIASIVKLDEIARNQGFDLESEEAEDAITHLKLSFQDYYYDERDDANWVGANEEENSNSHSGAAEQVDIMSEPSPFPVSQAKVAVADPAIQKALKLITSPDFQLPKADTVGRELLQEALTYVMFDNFERIISDSFEPTDQDCLHLRRHTTSVEKIEFACPIQMNTREEIVSCTCTDIGGQAQEQKKWEAQAAKVDFILFVTAMSDFDITRANGQNALMHQFELLSRILSAKCFSNMNVIVLLNKIDALEEKLKTSKLQTYFPDFTADNTVENAKIFFEQICEAINEATVQDGRGSKTRQVQVVPSCALDTKMVHNVLTSALGAALLSTLMEVGIM